MIDHFECGLNQLIRQKNEGLNVEYWEGEEADNNF